MSFFQKWIYLKKQKQIERNSHLLDYILQKFCVTRDSERSSQLKTSCISSKCDGGQRCRVLLFLNGAQTVW